jgi:hypothetical protein
LERSHNFNNFNNFNNVYNSNHLKDLVICILWTLVMSFSDAQAMILTVILTKAIEQNAIIMDPMVQCMSKTDNFHCILQSMQEGTDQPIGKA